MLLRQLEYFQAVVELESFTRAAKRCHISQSAISQQIKALEREIGTDLLKRKGRHISLTPTGEIVMACARDVLVRIDRMRFEIEHAASGSGSLLRIGYLSRYEGWELPSAIAAFTLRHPQVKVDTISGSHEDLYQGMLDGSISFAFSDRRRDLSDEFENIHLTTRHTVLEVSEANPLAKQNDIAVSELAGTPCILVATGETRSIERAYYHDTLNFPGPFVFANSLEEAHFMVAGNQGVLPLEVKQSDILTDGVIRHVPLINAEGPLVRAYYAFWPIKRTSWITKEFAQILGELMHG